MRFASACMAALLLSGCAKPVEQVRKPASPGVYAKAAEIFAQGCLASLGDKDGHEAAIRDLSELGVRETSRTVDGERTITSFAGPRLGMTITTLLDLRRLPIYYTQCAVSIDQGDSIGFADAVAAAARALPGFDAKTFGHDESLSTKAVDGNFARREGAAIALRIPPETQDEVNQILEISVAVTEGGEGVGPEGSYNEVHIFAQRLRMKEE